MFEISKTAKLPYNLAKGSFQKRFQNSSQYNDIYFKKLLSHIKNDSVPKDAFLKSIDEVLPSKIDLQIKSSKDFVCRGEALLSSLIDTVNGNKILTSYEMFLPMNKKEEVPLDKIFIAMHEFRHLFDFINNPKFMKRSGNVEEDLGLYFYNVFDFYENEIYTKKHVPMKDFQLKIKDLLEVFGEDYYYRISILQDFRNMIHMERNAFIDGQKYRTRLKKIYPDKIKMNRISIAKPFKFSKKLKVIEAQLRKDLIAARNKNKQSFARKSL